MGETAKLLRLPDCQKLAGVRGGYAEVAISPSAPAKRHRHAIFLRRAPAAAVACLSERMQPSDTGLVLIGAMLIIPQLTLIHPYLHLLIMAPLLVFTGCHRAKLELDKGAASQVHSA